MEPRCSACVLQRSTGAQRSFLHLNHAARALPRSGFVHPPLLPKCSCAGFVDFTCASPHRLAVAPRRTLLRRSSFRICGIIQPRKMYAPTWTLFLHQVVRAASPLATKRMYRHHSSALRNFGRRDVEISAKHYERLSAKDGRPHRSRAPFGVWTTAQRWSQRGWFIPADLVCLLETAGAVYCPKYASRPAAGRVRVRRDNGRTVRGGRAATITIFSAQDRQ